mmetsp:Transcript_5299/g.15535  ORF Transcript_5299/g.15535 Transcript_5299/m.15535 type:complete len:101 (-) Transcript_5299:45-347(-)
MDWERESGAQRRERVVRSCVSESIYSFLHVGTNAKSVLTMDGSGAAAATKQTRHLSSSSSPGFIVTHTINQINQPTANTSCILVLALNKLTYQLTNKLPK